MSMSLCIGDVTAISGNQTNTINNTNTNFTIKEVANASSRVTNLSQTYNIIPNYVEIYNNQTYLTNHPTPIYSAFN